MTLSRLGIVLGLSIIQTSVLAETYVTYEAGLAGFARNVARIPGDSGTLVDAAAWSRGSIFAQRIYAGYMWSQRHEIRLLWAPLAATVHGQSTSPVSFENKNFNANQPIEVFYKFNSYRATYAYHFEASAGWHWALGFSAKIRDAEIRLSQAGLVSAKKNIGFVPLINLQLRRDMGAFTSIKLDLDGMAAPQGRAIDAAVLVEYRITDANSAGRYSVYGGYRTIEGGADNDAVYNFAWINQGVLGFKGAF